MADAMQAAGVGPEVEYKGKVYHFQVVRVYEIGKFEAYLHRRAWEEVMRAEAWMPPAMHRRLEDGTRQDIPAGVYSYGSKAFRIAQVSDHGIKQMALISLKAGEKESPEVDGELIEALFRERSAQMQDAMVGIGWLLAPPKKDEKKADGDAQ